MPTLITPRSPCLKMQQGSQSRVGQISMQFTPASGSIPNGRQQAGA
jgi:hypothetical protein